MGSGGSANGVITVVLADDAEDLRLMLRLSLEREGDMQVVAEASGGAEAVRLAALHQPDVLILDLAMPGLSGRETIPAVLSVSPGTQVVVMSGSGRDHAESEVLGLGAAGYMEKGGSTTGIAETIRRLAVGPD